MFFAQKSTVSSNASISFFRVFSSLSLSSPSATEWSEFNAAIAFNALLLATDECLCFVIIIISNTISLTFALLLSPPLPSSLAAASAAFAKAACTFSSEVSSITFNTSGISRLNISPLSFFLIASLPLPAVFEMQYDMISINAEAHARRTLVFSSTNPFEISFKTSSRVHPLSSSDEKSNISQTRSHLLNFSINSHNNCRFFSLSSSSSSSSSSSLSSLSSRENSCCIASKRHLNENFRMICTQISSEG